MSYLLIGLGNPGKKFELTRHNAGRIFIRWMNIKGQGSKAKGQGVFEAAETECFMNESGGWVSRKISNLKFKISNLVIAHDDLDIPLGKFKIQFGKGPRLHNGVLSVEQALGTKEFWRVRIGVDSRKKEEGRRNKGEGEKYVLEQFTPEEKKILESVFPLVREGLFKKVTPFKV